MHGISENGDDGVVNFVWGDDDAGLWNGSLGSSGDVCIGFRNGDDGAIFSNIISNVWKAVSVRELACNAIPEAGIPCSR